MPFQIPRRSLGGCSTCRTRHAKCDETRPVCMTCTRSGLQCLGYQSRIFFVSAQADDNVGDADPTQFRRPLFTEKERESMSNALQSSMRSTTVNKALSRLDNESQKLETSEENSISHGPFSVFISSDSPELPTPDIPSLCQPASESEVIEIDEAYDDPLTMSEIDLGILGEDHSFGVNFAYSSLLWDSAIETAPGFTIQELDSDGFQLLSPSIHTGILGIQDASSQLSQRSSFIPRSLPMVPASERVVPDNAGFLLSNYKDRIIALLSPLKYHRKTPWNILQLPCAMNTLAGLTMGNQSNHAKHAIFHGLLSISAFNLASSSSGDANAYWKKIGEDYQKAAHTFLKESLAKEISGPSGPKRAKYKEILMAMLSMVSSSAFGGNLENAYTYLLDAERFIRMRGLPKPNKSRKLRLLHHCYAYLRLMYESTSIPPNHVRVGTGSFNDAEMQVRSNHGFGIAVWDMDFELQMNSHKDLETGMNDIHLEIPGEFPSTMYPDIYGIPESFMLLLSQAIRLGNERDIRYESSSETTSTMKDFNQRAKAIEKRICKWEPPPCHYPNGYDVSVDSSLIESNRRVITHLLLAMHQALIIFFYRRVYDTHPMILQVHAEKVIHHLFKVQEEDQINDGYTIGIVWPAFIAACEALSSDLQARFLAWFAASEKNSGMPTFKAAKDVATSVWARRQETGDDDVSWPTILREKRTVILCT